MMPWSSVETVMVLVPVIVVLSQDQQGDSVLNIWLDLCRFITRLMNKNMKTWTGR